MSTSFSHVNYILCARTLLLCSLLLCSSAPCLALGRRASQSLSPWSAAGALSSPPTCVLSAVPSH